MQFLAGFTTTRGSVYVVLVYSLPGRLALIHVLRNNGGSFAASTTQVGPLI